MSFLSFTVKKSIVKCHDFKLKLQYHADAFLTITSSSQIYGKANDVISYIQRQSFPECNSTTMSVKDLRGSRLAHYELSPVISVQYASSVPVASATKERLASCVSVIVKHIQDNAANITQAVSPFVNVSDNTRYPCLSVSVLSNETCCDGSAAKCCPANHVYVKQSNWATSYCCKYNTFTLRTGVAPGIFRRGG